MIEFYGTKGLYGFLSNFYPSKITLAGREWPTVEHFFQAMKSLEIDVQEQIRLLSTPIQAKTMGKKVKLREDWDSPVGTANLAKIFQDSQGAVVESAKDHFMFYALIEKFTQHQNLRDALLLTANEDLIENSPSDYYWGIGRNRTGRNKLGRMLQLVRSKLDKNNPIEKGDNSSNEFERFCST